MTIRPWRTEFFAEFADTIAASTVPVHRVLELGSGPGFLAEHLLSRLPALAYVALDFPTAMHELASQRLGTLATGVQFVTRSFRETGWYEGLGHFECVVTNQAVHVLRHKRYAITLHTQVRQILSPGGFYLVCDHFAGKNGMPNEQLYMSVEEQRSALLNAGFIQVRQLMVT